MPSNAEKDAMCRDDAQDAVCSSIAGYPVVLVCGTRPDSVHSGRARSRWGGIQEKLYDALNARCGLGRFLLLSGMADGPDYWAWYWAERRGLPRLAIPAVWADGKSAGIKRNLLMAPLASECIAVWDGQSKGTAHMVGLIKKRGIPLHIIEVPE